MYLTKPLKAWVVIYSSLSIYNLLCRSIHICYVTRAGLVCASEEIAMASRGTSTKIYLSLGQNGMYNSCYIHSYMECDN